jgi:hypothetical protein
MPNEFTAWLCAKSNSLCVQSPLASSNVEVNYSPEHLVHRDVCDFSALFINNSIAKKRKKSNNSIDPCS